MISPLHHPLDLTQHTGSDPVHAPTERIFLYVYNDGIQSHLYNAVLYCTVQYVSVRFLCPSLPYITCVESHMCARVLDMTKFVKKHHKRKKKRKKKKPCWQRRREVISPIHVPLSKQRARAGSPPAGRTLTRHSNTRPTPEQHTR